MADVLKVVTHKESQHTLAAVPDASSTANPAFAAMLVLRALAEYVRGIHEVRFS